MSSLAQQLYFPFPQKTSFSREDFFVSQSNQEAIHWIESWPWQHPILSLSGPTHSGKTHLGHIWSEIAHQAEILTWPFCFDAFESLKGKNLVLDFDNFSPQEQPLSSADEEALFHFYNRVLENKNSVLWISNPPPSQWDNIKLPDLRSRLRAIPAVFVKQPDDQLLSMIYIKKFHDLQWKVSPKIIQYLISHGPRSYKEIELLIDRLSEKLLEEKKTLSLLMIKSVL